MNEDEKSIATPNDSLSKLDQDKEDNDTVVCATANFVVKNFDKYLLLMDLIRPFALEIFTSLLYSFEYYVSYLIIPFTIDLCCGELLYTNSIQKCTLQ